MNFKSCKLGDKVEILSGFAFKSQNFNNEGRGLPLVRIRDVIPGKSDTFYDGAYDKRFLIRDGDLLVGMDGEFNRALWRGGLALLNQRVCKIYPKPNELDEGYLFYILPPILRKIEDKTPFVTVKHLSAGELKQAEVCLPSLDEQRRIAAILNQARHLREKHLQAADETERLLKSLLDLALKGQL